MSKIKAMNKYLKAVSANILFFVINIIFFLIITPIAIKIMGEEFYGLWTILLALMLFTNIGNLGVSTIVMKFASEVPKDNFQTHSNRIITSGFIIVGIMALLVAILLLLTRYLIASNINTQIKFQEQLNNAILWIALSIFPQFLIRVPQGFLLSQLHNQTVRQIELFSTISLWCGVILLSLIAKNLVYIAFWCFFSNIVILLFYVWSMNRMINFHFQFNSEIIKKMLNFSGYMFLESIAITLFQQVDKIIVGFTLGPTFAGVYSVGTSLALRLSMVSGQATEVMIPYASLKDSLGDQQRLYIIFRQLSRYVSLIIAIIGSSLIIWMHEILSLWISPYYAMQYTDTFSILIIAYSLLSISRPAHQTLTGMGKVKFTAIVYLLSTIIMLNGVFFLSSKFGLIGASAANMILISLLIFNLYVYHIFHNPIQWKYILIDLQWGLILPIIIFFISIFSHSLGFKIISTIGIAIFLTRSITKDDFIKSRLFSFKQIVCQSRKL